MSRVRNPVLAVLFAAAIFAGLMFLFSSTSVLETFQLYPHDAQGGSALYFIEVVLACITAAIGGLVFYHRISCGSWFPSEEHREDGDTRG